VGVHLAGGKRADWTTDDRRTTLVLLVQGHFRVDLTEGSVTFARQGDYAVWVRESTTHGKPYRTRWSLPFAGRVTLYERQIHAATADFS